MRVHVSGTICSSTLMLSFGLCRSTSRTSNTKVACGGISEPGRQNVAWRPRARGGERRSTSCGIFTWAFFAVGLEGWDDDVPDLPHTHPQQALIHALYQPALTHQGVLGLLPGVATWGSYNRKVKHTTHLGGASRHTKLPFQSRKATTNPADKEQARSGAKEASPGVKRGAVQQRAVEMVADKVGAHHRAFAVFGRGDAFGDNQVGFVPHVQQVDVEHQRGIGGNHLTCGDNVSLAPARAFLWKLHSFKPKLMSSKKCQKELRTCKVQSRYLPKRRAHLRRCFRSPGEGAQWWTCARSRTCPAALYQCLQAAAPRPEGPLWRPLSDGCRMSETATGGGARH